MPPKLAPSLGAGAVPNPEPKLERAPVIPEKKRSHGNETGTVQLAIEFCAWAHERRFFPTPVEIQDRFGVCRATAYRWRRYLANVFGIDPPPFDESED